MGILDIFRRTTTVTTPAPAPRKRNGFEAAKNLSRYGDMGRSRGSADYELRDGLVEVRSKARDMARNSGSMRRFIQLMQVNVVGAGGFQLRTRVRRGDDSIDSNLNRAVEGSWRGWCQAPTVDGRMTMVDLCEQAVHSWCTDGEVIWEIVYNSRYPDGMAVNPLEADMLDETLVRLNPATNNEIRMGVEIDEYGAPVAYHFLTRHPGDLAWYSNENTQRHRRVPADRVIHLYRRNRPGQTRGEPPAAASINPIKMLNGYREAETMGRRLRAALMGFFTKALPSAEQISQLADTETDDDAPMFEMHMEPGIMKQLPDGMEFKAFEPGGATTDYQQFESQVKKDIAMSLGVSAFSHGMETSGVSYSTGRTVAIEDRDFYKTMQRFFIDGAMWPLFKKWANSKVLADNSPIMPTRVGGVIRYSKFMGRGWDWVDPAKDVKANVEALRTKQTSLSRVAASRGIDVEDLLREIKEDEEMARSMGLTLDYSSGKPDAAQPAREEADDDDDNDDS